MSEEVKPESVSLYPASAAATPEREAVCIFGTGDLGRSLGQRLLQSGYRLVYGSRKPHSCGPIPPGTQVMSHEAAAQSTSLVFVCVHREHYDFLETLAPQLNGKVLVDVSNNLKKNMYPEANAEYLQRLIPGAHVVKAFNTLSAWALQNGPSDANRQVYLCGNNPEAKQAVAVISTKLGFTVQDRGSLSAARELEDFPLQLFPEWRLPMRLTVGLTAFFFFYLLTRDVIYAYVNEGRDISFRIMMSLANKVFPSVSLILLSLCYLPGVIAGFFQLYRGTKYKRFPDWLDRWMLCRKQLGLIALALASLHVLYTLIIPIRYYVRFRLAGSTISQIKNNKTSPFDTTMAWRTDSYYSIGALGFGLYLLLGISSLPSVSNALSWREFSFIQGLSEGIKDELSTRDPPKSLADLESMASRIDQRMHERRLERASDRHYPPPGAPSRLVTTSQFPRPSSSPPQDQPEPMQIGRSRLTPEERDRRLKKGLCFYCGSEDHQLRQCPSKRSSWRQSQSD